MFSSSKNMSVAKGMGIGIAVGTMAAVASTKMMSCGNMKACKKKAAKCMRCVENVMNEIACSMK